MAGDAQDILRLGLEASRIVAGELAREGCDCILLSGGIDTSFVALSARLYGQRISRAILVAGPGDPDYPYAVWVAERLGLRLHTVDPRERRDQFWTAAETAAIWLETIDPVEVAGGAALLLGLHEAKSLGCGCAATGDGGDELFLGYSFLHNAPPGKLQEWRARMESGAASFQSLRLQHVAGLRVATPLYSEPMRRLVRQAPTSLLLGPAPEGAQPGKAPLRLTLHLAGLERVALRRKTPVTHGSGSLLLLEEIARGKPVSQKPWLPTRMHAVLQYVHDRAGTRLPQACRDPKKRCPVCGSCMRGRFCPYCGAYIHDDGRVTVHTGHTVGKKPSNNEYS